MKYSKKDIVVSFTSWTDRIDMAAARVEEMIQQTLQPERIYLNLAIEDFPNKDVDLDDTRLGYLIFNYNDIEINWCHRNDRVFLKFLPTLNQFIGATNILIATIDDDISYAPNYLEELVKNWELNGEPNKFCMSSVPDNGGREIYMAGAFKKDIFDYLTPEIINNQIDDVFYRLYLEKNGKVCKFDKGSEDEVIKLLPKTTRGICDTYAPNGNTDWQYINNAISEMKNSLGL